MRVIEYPNPALKQRADEVDPSSDAHIRHLIEKMTRVMTEASAVGLAATQVGVQKRVIMFRMEEEGEACVLLNPAITSRSAETRLEEEGCLSFPGITVPIERPASIVCTGLSPEGEDTCIEADDLLARVLQHEVDHLNGILIIDRTDPEERQAALRRYRELGAE